MLPFIDFQMPMALRMSCCKPGVRVWNSSALFRSLISDQSFDGYLSAPTGHMDNVPSEKSALVQLYFHQYFLEGIIMCTCFVFCFVG
jgi:hypothetical protein